MLRLIVNATIWDDNDLHYYVLNAMWRININTHILGETGPLEEQDGAV